MRYKFKRWVFHKWIVTARFDPEYFVTPHISIGWGDWSGLTFDAFFFNLSFHKNIGQED
jgi:hypothetical protein